MADDVVERVASALRARGERMTAPRGAVVRALHGLGEHATSEQVVTRVAQDDPPVHRASVYRTLEVLRDLGVVVHVHLAHGGTAYQLVEDGEHPHLHGQCQDCGVVVDLPRSPLDRVVEDLAATTGFAVDPDHVALSGRCAACASA